MAAPYHHAVSSQRKHGGLVSDFLPVHNWFDETKKLIADFRHRALRHHAEGIFLCEQIFGVTVSLSTCAVCGETADEGAHGYSISVAEVAFMNDGGRDELLARRVETLRRDEHAFVPKQIPTRWIGEQHVLEDLGRIPTAADWLRTIRTEPWMQRSRRLSLELERSA